MLYESGKEGLQSMQVAVKEIKQRRCSRDALHDRFEPKREVIEGHGCFINIREQAGVSGPMRWCWR